jgi:glutathione S-transferase
MSGIDRKVITRRETPGIAEGGTPAGLAARTSHRLPGKGGAGARSSQSAISRYSCDVGDPYRLITIPPSHFCEKARWALDRVGVPYTEERYPPVLHYRACRRAGGGRTTPVLVTDVGVYADSTDILEFLDSRHADGWRPYPADGRDRAEVVALEELFDTRLGPHTRRVAYFHLLPHREMICSAACAGVRGGDHRIFRAALPLVRWLMRRGMQIEPASAARSLERVREVFRTVSRKVEQGREYLVGDRFSAADLTFAALAAPVLLPRGYGSPMPTLADLPGGLLPLIDEMRSSPAGDFGLRLYRDHR